MPNDRWTEIDAWFVEHLSPPDDALNAALADSEAAGLRAINVAPNQGKLLHLLARAIGARTMLEIGTLGGYSTIWLARALPPGGRLVTLEIDPVAAGVARRNLARAGVDDRVEIRLGPALESLPRLAAEGFGPVDFSFIDADKSRNSDYLRWALQLARPGGLIVIDNVVRGGRVIEADNDDPSVQGTRRLVELLAGESRVSCTALQTVGSKGYDGFILAYVNP